MYSKNIIKPQRYNCTLYSEIDALAALVCQDDNYGTIVHATILHVTLRMTNYTTKFLGMGQTYYVNTFDVSRCDHLPLPWFIV